MAALASLAALAALLVLAVPGPGKFVAVGLGLLAFAAGLVAFRRTGPRPGARLLGAGAAAVALVALLLGGTKVALTLVAVERIARSAPAQP